jgi:hypothetical protein
MSNKKRWYLLINAVEGALYLTAFIDSEPRRELLAAWKKGGRRTQISYSTVEAKILKILQSLLLAFHQIRQKHRGACLEAMASVTRCRNK